MGKRNFPYVALIPDVESPRTHFEVLGLGLEGKSLTLASKPQVLENWSVLGWRTALLFESLKFCEAPKKFLEDFFFCNCLKIFCADLFFGEHLRLRSWSLALASSIPTAGRLKTHRKAQAQISQPKIFKLERKRKFRNQNFLGLKRKRKFHNQNF